MADLSPEDLAAVAADLEQLAPTGHAPATALWVAAARAYDVGRDLFAAYQVDRGRRDQSDNVLVPPWADLTVSERLAFYELCYEAGVFDALGNGCIRAAISFVARS
jgi:hypothetical protein